MNGRVRYKKQYVIINSFYQLPKFLFDAEFDGLSNDARVLYALLRNRHEISVKNGWFDEKDEVFLYFKREDMQTILGLSERTIAKIMRDLKSYRLLEETQQGLGKPNRIYLLTVDSVLHGIGEGAGNAENTQTRKNYGSETAEFTGQDPQELRHMSYNNNIQNNIIHNPVMSCQSELSPDRQDKDKTVTTAQKIEVYTALIKDNISYGDLARSIPHEMNMVDEFITIIIDTLLTKGDTVRIGGEDKPRELVKSTLLKLNFHDIELVIDQFKSVATRISKKKQYILTMLYNCKLEGTSHFANLVISDMWQ